MRSPVNVAPATTTLLRNEFFECPIAVRSPFNDLDEWRWLRGELHATRSRTDVESIHAATCGGCPEVLPRQIITHASVHGAVALEVNDPTKLLRSVGLWLVESSSRTGNLASASRRITADCMQELRNSLNSFVLDGSALYRIFTNKGDSLH